MDTDRHGTMAGIDVKNGFLMFFFIFQTFFKNVGKVQSGKQVNKS